MYPLEQKTSFRLKLLQIAFVLYFSTSLIAVWLGTIAYVFRFMRTDMDQVLFVGVQISGIGSTFYLLILGVILQERIYGIVERFQKIFNSCK